MKEYSSPKIEFKNLKLRESISDICWGQVGSGKNYYYDTDGIGWIKFTVSQKNCNGSADSISLSSVLYENPTGGTSNESAAIDQFMKQWDIWTSPEFNSSPFKNSPISDKPDGWS